MKQDYARASEMLQPAPYPESYPALKKLDALKRQAQAAGQSSNFYRVPQTTFFPEGPNKAGIDMKASTGSGQDCTGVNDGSKNTVLVTYLADAWNWGAEIFCECEVRYIEEDKERGGYIVFFAWLGARREAFEDDILNKLMWVRAVSYTISVPHRKLLLIDLLEGTVLSRCRCFGYHRDSPAFSETWIAYIDFLGPENFWQW